MKGDELGEKQTSSEEGGRKRSQDDNRYVGNHQGLHKHLSDSLRDTHTLTLIHTHPQRTAALGNFSGCHSHQGLCNWHSLKLCSAQPEHLSMATLPHAHILIHNHTHKYTSTQAHTQRQPYCNKHSADLQASSSPSLPVLVLPILEPSSPLPHSPGKQRCWMT